MIELRICPICQKVFYTPSELEILSCPHCGYVIYDRRRSDRISKETDLTIVIGGKRVTARLKDYSESGLRIVYKGASLEVDTVLEVDSDELGLHGPAKAVWSKKFAGSTASSGLKLL